jgi:glycine/D-amino acid oxidase-like deaminating enzyme
MGGGAFRHEMWRSKRVARMSERQPLRLGRPIWLRNAGHLTQHYPALTGHHRTDIVVVGGGFTGALVAQAFADANIAVTLLEAGRVGNGSTAASSALLLQEPDLGLAELEQHYGRSTSRRLWQLSAQAALDLAALLRRLAIPCDLRTHDTVYYATNRDSVERLHQEFVLRTKAGFAGQWLTPGELRQLTAIPGRGAIHTHGGAQFDPYRACLGMVQAASASGAHIFEKSPVVRIDAGRDRVRVWTRHGMTEARCVVIATGYATSHFRPLAGRFRMYRTYVIATEPLNPSMRLELGLSDVMVWDTERPYHYARWTPDHRLLLGGGDRRVRAGRRRRSEFTTATRELRDYFEDLLPAFATIDTQVAWEGLFAMTPDSFPYIGAHRRYPGHLFALGYGGNGMTFGFLAARLLLEQWQGVKSSDHELFRFDRPKQC